MSLVSMKEMLADARSRKYAVPMFDVSNYEMAKCLADTAEELRSPIILAAIIPDIKGNALDYITALMKVAAANTSVPMAIHLDHSDSFANCKRCIDAGFNSVMIDASTMSFAENAAATKEVVDYAHKFGVTVEAELGHVPTAISGCDETGKIVDKPESISDSLTNVEDVKRFLAETGVDALAVAIGTAHGCYVSAPKLDIGRLAEINAASSACLVLHGGSGTPEDQLKAAVANGITKINIYTDIVRAYNTAMKNEFDKMANIATWPVVMAERPVRAMSEKVASYMEIFGSAQKA